jgi:hypothetical protein
MAKLLAGLAAALLLAVAPAAQAPPGSGDLDAFMAAVLTRRDENWKKLQQYVLDEREQISLRSLGHVPLWGEVREYTWYLRDGFFVRSPLTVNGAPVGEDDRRAYEARYFQRVRQRDASRGEPPAGAAPPPESASGGDVQAFILQTRQPQFVDSAYFLRFRFEPSRYAFVGRETFEGRDVLRIEYYPVRLFRHEQEQQERRRETNDVNRDKDRAAEVERMMNRVSLVTLWVEPNAHQIVKYTFDNVNLDFLPAASLIRMDDAEAVMTMSEPFPGVWLPRDVEMAVAATLAVGSFDIRYRLDYSNYRQAETSSRFTPGDGR